MINRGDDNISVGYSTNKIGIKLSVTKPSTVSIDNAPIFYSNNVITDTLNWVKIFGSFIANANYKYIMIGNFFDDSNTTITNQSSGIYAYYFIDDVCLSTDSVFAYNYITGVKDNKKFDNIKIYPTQADDKITLEMPDKGKDRIQNIHGKIILEVNAEIGKNQIICSEWEAGVYILKINEKTFKILINH